MSQTMTRAEAAGAALGAMLTAQRVIDPVLFEVGLRPEHLSRERDRRVLEAIRALSSAGDPIDTLTVADKLESQGAELPGQLSWREYLQSLSITCPVPGHAQRYAEIAREGAVQDAYRRMLQAELAEAEASFDRQVSVEALGKMTDLLLSGEGRRAEVSYAEAEHRALERADRLAKGEIQVQRSGIDGLDRYWDSGIEPGALTVLGAAPSVGKSLFAQQIARHVAGEGRGVAFFSLEMSETALGTRFLAHDSGVSMSKLSRPDGLGKLEWRALVEAGGRAENLPFWINSSSFQSIETIKARARAVAARAETAGAVLGLVVVDYLQLLDIGVDPGANYAQMIARSAQGLKQLAGDLDVHVLAASQLNRSPSVAERRPRIQDLRDGGGIEAAADNVLLAWNPNAEEQPDVVEVVLGKVRQGASGKAVELYLDGARMRFVADDEGSGDAVAVL